MFSRKMIFGIVFVSLLNNFSLPLQAMNSVAIKESSRELKNLKERILCFKSKEGCSRRQIAAIVSVALGLIAIISGGIFVVVKSRKDMPMTPENLKKILQKEDVTPFKEYLKNYKDMKGNNVLKAAEQLGIAMPISRWEYLKVLIEDES